MTPRHSLFADIPAELPQEHCQTLLSGGAFRLERIVSRGQASPPGFWYDQDEVEWVLLVSGRAALRFAGDERLVELAPGDHVHIPARCRHRVEWTDPGQDTVWLAIFHHP